MQKFKGHAPRRAGFTLVELVVVVMILGILAAVAAPKLLSTSGAATDNGLKQTLAVVRDAIERYAAENNGELPGKDGNVGDFETDIQPYLRGDQFPACPVKQNDRTVVPVNGPSALIPGAEAGGWKYDYTLGGFIINSGEDTADDSDGATTYDQL
jgi:general secretion pathway protein G